MTYFSYIVKEFLGSPNTQETRIASGLPGNLGKTKTGETNTGETISGETISGETKTGETKTGETKTGETILGKPRQTGETDS